MFPEFLVGYYRAVKWRGAGMCKGGAAWVLAWTSELRLSGGLALSDKQAAAAAARANHRTYLTVIHFGRQAGLARDSLPRPSPGSAGPDRPPPRGRRRYGSDCLLLTPNSSLPWCQSRGPGTSSGMAERTLEAAQNASLHRRRLLLPLHDSLWVCLQTPWRAAET